MNASSRLLHDLAIPANVADFAKVISSATERAMRLQRQALPRSTRPPMVAYSFSDYHYADAFDNWLHATRAALMLPLIAALDEDTYDFFEARGVDVVLLRDTKPPHSRLAARYLYIRTLVVSRLLRSGLRVCFSEMDGA